MERLESTDRTGTASLSLGHFVLDLARQELRDAQGGHVPLRNQALQVLVSLGLQAGHVVTKDELLQRVWPNVIVTEDSLVQAITDIRRALGHDGRRLVRTVAKRGYMLMPGDGSGGGGTAAALPRESVNRGPKPSAKRLGSRVLLPAVASLLALIALSALVVRSPTDEPAPRLAKPTLAVLAFRGENDGKPDPILGQGIAEELIGDLSRDTGLPVVSARSSFQLDLQTLSTQDVASRLKVRYLVDGQVRRDGDLLQIRIQLIAGDDGRIVWTRDDRVGIADAAKVRRALIEQLAGTLDATVLRVEKQRVLARPTSSLDAYTLGMRAYAFKHQFTPAATHAGRADAQRATQLDPDYAFAWATLAYVNTVDILQNLTGEWPLARTGEALAQFDRAIQLDPGLAIAHQGRANALMLMGRMPEGLEAARTALSLSPGDPDNLTIFALAAVYTEHLSEARAAMDRASALYPLKPSYASMTESLLQWAEGDLEASLASATYCTDRTPKFGGCWDLRIRAQAELGRADAARADLARMRTVDPGLAGYAARRTLYSHAPSLLQRRQRVEDQLGFLAAR